jgi:hypothetical protein
LYVLAYLAVLRYETRINILKTILSEFFKCLFVNLFGFIGLRTLFSFDGCSCDVVSCVVPSSFSEAGGEPESSADES